MILIIGLTTAAAVAAPLLKAVCSGRYREADFWACIAAFSAFAGIFLERL